MKKTSFLIVTLLLSVVLVTLGLFAFFTITKMETQISALEAEVSNKAVLIEELKVDVADKAAL